MEPIGRFVANIIIRIVVLIFVLTITAIINYIYCKQTKKEFSFGKFILVFSILLLPSFPMYFTYVM